MFGIWSSTSQQTGELQSLIGRDCEWTKTICVTEQDRTQFGWLSAFRKIKLLLLFCLLFNNLKNNRFFSLFGDVLRSYSGWNSSSKLQSLCILQISWQWKTGLWNKSISFCLKKYWGVLWKECVTFGRD